jgi:hypothetical protein
MIERGSGNPGLGFYAEACAAGLPSAMQRVMVTGELSPTAMLGAKSECCVAAPPANHPIGACWGRPR